MRRKEPICLSKSVASAAKAAQNTQSLSSTLPIQCYCMRTTSFGGIVQSAPTPTFHCKRVSPKGSKTSFKPVGWFESNFRRKTACQISRWHLCPKLLKQADGLRLTTDSISNQLVLIRERFETSFNYSGNHSKLVETNSEKGFKLVQPICCNCCELVLKVATSCLN